MATVRSGLLATVSAFALMGSAYAADLPAAPALKAPPLAVSSWAGWYAGIQGGYARLNFSANMQVENGLCGDGPGGTCTGSASGFAAGGQLGYLWQNRNWVWGFEADGMWTDLKHTLPQGANFASGIVQGKVDWLASVRTRSGIAIDDTYMYVTGGVAFAGVRSGWGAGYNGPTSCVCDVKLNKTQVGWVAGFGVEHKLNQTWSIRSEALYYDLGHSSGAVTSSGTTYTSEFHHEVFMFRTGLNFKF